MQKAVKPKLPVPMPKILSPSGANEPLHDTTFKNAIISFYNNKQALPGVIFTCEHSSNALPPQYKWSASDKKNFAGAHWAQDIGCLRLALGLSESLKTAVCWAKYTRLLCDVNRTPALHTMFRKKGDGLIVDLNSGTGYKKGLDIDERSKRLHEYWYGYWAGVRRLLDHWKKDNANPKNEIDLKKRYVFSIHSFSAVYEGNPRQIQVGVLATHYPALAEYFEKGFKKAGYDARINEPYNPCHGANQAATAGNPQGETAHSRFFAGYNKEGKEGTLGDGIRHILFEIRDDLLVNDAEYTRIRKVIVNLITRLFRNGNPTLTVKRPINKNPNPKQIEFENAVVMNFGGHKNEKRGDTRICFSTENCSVNPTKAMLANMPRELEILMKKGQLGSPNVQKLGMMLAKEFDTILLSTKYSKAICDVTRPPTSQHIIPEQIEFFENGKLTQEKLKFNCNITEKIKEARIKRYYFGFIKGFQYIRSQLAVQPFYWMSLRHFSKGHIHPGLLKAVGYKQLPDIIINSMFFPHVAARLAHALQYPQMINTSLRTDMNGLINPKMMFDYMNHTYTNAVIYRACAGIIIYINEETISANHTKVFEALKTAFLKVCFEMHDAAETFRFIG